MTGLHLFPLLTAVALLLAACAGDGSYATPSVTSVSPTIANPSAAAPMKQAQGTITNVSNSQLKALLKQGVTVVDIRRPDEWKETGIVPGSLKLTLFDEQDEVNPAFPKTIKQIAPPNKPVILICRTGNRSGMGSQILTQTGYSQVYNVTHGITDWITEGNPVSKP